MSGVPDSLDPHEFQDYGSIYFGVQIGPTSILKFNANSYDRFRTSLHEILLEARILGCLFHLAQEHITLRTYVCRVDSAIVYFIS